jgi:hypothetical protein
LSDFYMSRRDAINAFQEANLGLNFKEVAEIFEFKGGAVLTPKSPLKAALEIVKAFKSQS